jgi:hypothetical protein
LGDINTGTWSSKLGVERKADGLAALKKYCCEIQKSENLIQSGRISQERLRLKKGCFAVDDDDDAKMAVHVQRQVK